MVVPTDTTVMLKITASDVIHSWWIPKLGGKADAVPGHVERDLVQDPASRGTYSGQCAELCGSDHADMRAAGARGDAGRSTNAGRSSSARTSSDAGRWTWRPSASARAEWRGQ